MPISTDSDAWQEATREDFMEVHIGDLLRNNRDQAYSVSELEEHLLEDYPELFPSALKADEATSGPKEARQAVITNVLFEMYRRSRVTFRYVTNQDEGEPGLYVTDDGAGFWPVAELDEVKDVAPDSPHGTLSSRFREKDDEVEDLEERVDWLEFRVHEELGAY